MPKVSAPSGIEPIALFKMRASAAGGAGMPKTVLPEPSAQNRQVSLRLIHVIRLIRPIGEKHLLRILNGAEGAAVDHVRPGPGTFPAARSLASRPGLPASCASTAPSARQSGTGILACHSTDSSQTGTSAPHSSFDIVIRVTVCPRALVCCESGLFRRRLIRRRVRLGPGIPISAPGPVGPGRTARNPPRRAGGPRAVRACGRTGSSPHPM